MVKKAQQKLLVNTVFEKYKGQENICSDVGESYTKETAQDRKCHNLPSEREIFLVATHFVK